jgi:hypothetical protein
MSVKGGPNTVTSGLVLELDAGNIKSYPRSGTTWFDKSGNANNGTLTNGPTFNTGSLGSIVFDGVDDYVEIPGTQFRNLLSTDCTISLFLGFENKSGLTFPTIIGSMTFGSSWQGWRIVADNVSNILFFSNASGVNGNSQDNLEFNYTLPNNINTLTHLTATWVASTREKKTYVNGVLTNSGISTRVFSANSTNMQIGRTSEGFGDNYLRGKIPSIQIYNRALSADEVLQNYNATKGRFGL